MKTVYIAQAAVPSQSANSIHVMKISEAFTELTEDFVLIVPECKESHINEDIYDYYGIQKTFPIERVKQKKAIGGMYRYYFAACATCKALKLKCEKIITRDPIVALMAVLLHKRVVLDLHGEIAHLAGRAYRMIRWNWFKKSKYLKIVMITDSLVTFYKNKYGLEPDITTVLPDGCTLENFEPYCNNPLLEKERMSIAYVGSFGVGRGYEVIHELAKQDQANSYYIYGGVREDAIAITGQEPPANIYFQGFVANKLIPIELCKQDILLIPYQNLLIAKGEDTGKVMSPLKLFEYMASGRVIIASDLSVLREILNDTNSYFAVPEDAASWKEIIEDINQDRTTAKQKAAQAKKDVCQYTWKIRAERMLELMN